MKISLNWLKQYVAIKESPFQVADLLTMHSCEVDDVIRQSQNLDKIVVGQIKNIRKHPNADKLQLVDTQINKNDIVQIVCGGTNLRINMFVAVALVGAKIRWHGEGDLIELQKVKLRGEESNGMICLDSEIGLGNNIGTEIMDLEDLKDVILVPGLPLAEAMHLNDVTLDIDQKSLTHRSDLFCHIGIAREYAALTNRKLMLPKINKINVKNQCKFSIAIEDKKLCPYYTAIVLDKIKIKESPIWMQRHLKSAGMRPINNIVDIANYVMLEYGQPLHTFDYHKIKKHQLIVRLAKNNEKVVTLDQKERKLFSDTLIIADAEKPIDIAGIMGGNNTEIDNQTTTVLLESANFDKVNIRKSGMKLGIHTEAVMRFEKGLPLDLPKQALHRAIDLYVKYANAEVSSKIFESKKVKLKNKIISFDLRKLNDLSGINIPKQKVIKILNSLQFEVINSKKDILKISIPSFRTDIELAEDVIEEICRIYGYDNIKPQALTSELLPVDYLPDLKWGDKFSKILASSGFVETMNYSFCSLKEINKCNLHEEEHLELVNPVSDDLKYLRSSLLPGLLSNLKKNIDNNFSTIKLFEIGHLYFKPDKDEKYLALIQSGENTAVYYELKGVIEYLAKKANIYLKFINNDIILNNQNIGCIKLLDDSILKNYGIKDKVVFAQINLLLLSNSANTNIKFVPIPIYPAVSIDLSIIVDKKILWQEIESEIKRSNKLINNVELFDVYNGDKIGIDNKSLSMHLSFMSLERTLTMKEVEDFREKIMIHLNNKFKVKLRDK